MSLGFRKTCRVCYYDGSIDEDHFNSNKHKFSLKKWEWVCYRPAILRDKNGITFTIEPKDDANPQQFSFNYNTHGKYIVKITPSCLSKLNNLIEFTCSITNTNDTNIYITSAQLLIPETLFNIYFIGTNPFKYGGCLELESYATFKFEIFFKTPYPVPSSYHRPIVCGFQIGDKLAFTIGKIIVIEVSSEEILILPPPPAIQTSWDNVITYCEPKEDKKISHLYKIPKKYIKVLSAGLQEYESMSSSDRKVLEQIRNKIKIGHLTRKNYAEYFHILLWMEEMAQKLYIRRYDMNKIKVRLINTHIIELDVPGLGEKRPSLIVGDRVFLRLHNDKEAYGGIINKVNEESLDVAQHDSGGIILPQKNWYFFRLINYLMKNANVADLDVKFELARLSFERMHIAVEKMHKEGMISCILSLKCNKKRLKFPPPIHNYYNPTIKENPQQITAIRNILNCSTAGVPYIVYGPPGTGKTITIVEAILQIKKQTDKKILVCAPANSACDLIALSLIPHCDKNELIRIHARNRNMEHIEKDLMPFSNIRDGEFQTCSEKMINKYRIVITTLIFIGRFTPEYSPDMLFIDEATQASEPESVVAISMLKRRAPIILAGDPKQLGPICISRIAAQKYGLEISLMERLINSYAIYKNFNENYVTMLNLNFRSHSLLLELPNKFTYKNQLVPMSEAALNDCITNISIFTKIFPKEEFKNYKGQPIEFCSVSDKERQDSNSSSLYNPSEVAMVLMYIKTLLHLNLPTPVRQEDIGVITPYSKQVAKIKYFLSHFRLLNVKVGTTYSFQGEEKRIIIISPVRAQYSLLLHDKKYNLGLVSKKRFNVAITRAISKLIVIGCPLVLQTDNKWRALMDMCKRLQVFYGVAHFEYTTDVTNEILSRIMPLKFDDF